MQLENTLRKLAEETLEGTGLFLVDVAGSQTGRRFRVIVDGDQGVSIGQCVSVSRQISAQLDTMDLPDSAFTFEVSSPGADAPLKMQRQYPQHIGRTMNVWTLGGQMYEGVLQSTDDEGIVLSPEPVKGWTTKKKIVPELPDKLAWAEIKESKIVLKFK